MYISILPKEYLQHLRKSTLWKGFFLFSLVVNIVHQLFHAILYHFTFILWPTMKAVTVHTLISLHVKIRSLTFLKLSVSSTNLVSSFFLSWKQVLFAVHDYFSELNIYWKLKSFAGLIFSSCWIQINKPVSYLKWKENSETFSIKWKKQQEND